MTRHAKLKIGEIYKNKGGGIFLCIREMNKNTYQMLNVKSRWMFEAHDITMYEDGTIEWDYSSNGYFSELKYKGEVK